MKENKKNILQLFAGDGAAAGASGAEGAADAGQQGEGLGEIRANGQDAAANPKSLSETLTWEDIMAVPEFNREVQKIVRCRLQREQTHGKESSEVAEVTDRAGILEHILGLEQQAQAMQTIFPGFDLRKELADPLFAKLTAPEVGMRVEDAFYALHHDVIQSAAMQATAQKTAQMVTEAIRSGSFRPRENGTGSQGPSVATFDYRAATDQQRDALKKRIRAAAARGEKLYPGQ